MRSKYSRRRKFRGTVQKIKRPFKKVAVKWNRMRRKNKIIVAGSMVASLVCAVLLVMYIPGLAYPSNEPMIDEAAEVEAVEQAPQPSPTPRPTPKPTPTPDPTLLEGMESTEVKKLQSRLMDLGYLDIDETTEYYGPATNYAVQLFQRQHGLDMDGVCGPKTLEYIYSNDAKMYTLLQGTEGNDVDMLQERLQELGYLSKITGYYGTETIEAVQAFQKRNDLGVDGKTGQETLDMIYSSDAQPTEELENQIRRRGTIREFLASAENQLGKKYVGGAAGPNTFDCSGLVTYCLRQAGSSTGRLNAAGFSQNSRWENISSMGNLEIGDLLFFSTNGKRIGHTGIYIGDGMMIDASSANGKVIERSCMSSYWTSHFVNARRPW